MGLSADGHVLLRALVLLAASISPRNDALSKHGEHRLLWH